MFKQDDLVSNTIRIVKSTAVSRQRPRKHDGKKGSEVAIFEATERLLQERPLHELTVAQIIAAAGISRGNFYHYFASKHDVLVALVQQIFEEVYGESQPWNEPLGKSRDRTMAASVARSIDMWTSHGAVIRATVENMHAVPALATVWQTMLQRFVVTIADQIRYERDRGVAPAGAPPEMIATMLLCGAERSYYVGSFGLDDRLPSPQSAVDALVALTKAATYGKTSSATNDSETTTPAPAVQPISEAEHALAPNTTQDLILHATNELLLEHSFDELSVEQILKKSRISRATFYFYFSSKDDVFVALLNSVVRDIFEFFDAIVGIDIADDRSAGSSAVSAWLRIEQSVQAVVRNAFGEWPRRPEIRRVYLDGMERMGSILEKKIDLDRERGLAPQGVSSRELSSVVLWTIERTLAGSLLQEANLEDTAAVTDMLGQVFVSTIYGY